MAKLGLRNAHWKMAHQNVALCFLRDKYFLSLVTEHVRLLLSRGLLFVLRARGTHNAQQTIWCRFNIAEDDQLQFSRLLGRRTYTSDICMSTICVLNPPAKLSTAAVTPEKAVP